MTDTRFLFRPVAAALVVLLERLQPADFERPTVAGNGAYAMSSRT